MKYAKLMILLLMAALLVVSGCERKVTEQITKVISPSSAQYLGSKACEACHEATYASFKNTGHPYKLNDADSVQQGDYYPEFCTPVQKPTDLAWSDIDMVIGGFWWKARYIDKQYGAVYTGPDRQYNLIEGHVGFVKYDTDAPGFKDYNCGPCHTTGYVAQGNQNGKDSLIGTWALNGIQCEECHGPGELHAADPYDVGMVIDRSSEACGRCHVRDAVDSIPASKGFIGHHEQWNEMFTTKHMSLKCVDCHDPHVTLHPSAGERDMAIRVACEDCHWQEAESFANTDIEKHKTANGRPDECIDCHMPRAAKSAVKVATYEADVRSHLWRINTAADAEMYYTGTDDKDYANGYLTVEFTCLQCHTDPEDTKAWAAQNASRAHAANLSEVSSCFNCHNDAEFGLTVLAAEKQWEHSVHASGNNIDRNRNYKSYYQACEKCHTNEGFLAEVTGIPAVGDNFTAIGCFTCHAPHTNGSFVLRVTSAVALGNGASFDRGPANLCTSCHQGRQNVDDYVSGTVTFTNTHWGPHYSTQADMLIGENAYEYAGYGYDNSAHTNTATEGCIDCHKATPIGYAVGGHTFNMHDQASGHENFNGCNVANCHDGDITTFNHEGVQDGVEALLDSLKTLLVDAGLIDDVDFKPIKDVVTSQDSAGAVFNYLFVHEDRSEGVHNTDYAFGLLESSINYITTGNPSGAPAITRSKLFSAH